MGSNVEKVSIEHFIEDQCSFGDDLWSSSKDLYEAYISFCNDHGGTSRSMQFFGRSLEKRFSFYRVGQARGWKGIALKSAHGSPLACNADHAKLFDLKGRQTPPWVKAAQQDLEATSAMFAINFAEKLWPRMFHALTSDAQIAAFRAAFIETVEGV